MNSHPTSIDPSHSQSPLDQNSQQILVQQHQIHHQQHANRHLIIPYKQFEDQYQSSIILLNPTTQQKIQKWTFNRQTENYLYFIQPQKFVQFTHKQRLLHFQQHNSELITGNLLNAMKKRQNNIQQAIINDTLQVKSRNKQPKKTIAKQQQQGIIANSQYPPQMTLQEQKAHQQQLRKRHQQIIYQHKKQRIRLQKLKQQQQLKKQQLQSTKLNQDQKQKQQMKKHHSQIISKKNQQHQEKRQTKLKQRDERNKDYQFIVKSWANGALLHEKMEREFMKRYEAMFDDQRKKIQSQKAKFSLNARVQDLNIKDHQNRYLTKRSQREAVRAAKLEEQHRIIEFNQKQLKKYNRYKRPNEQQQNNSDGDENDHQSQQDSQSRSKFSSTKRDKTYQELQQQKRAKAMVKRKKMQDYWETFVKQEKQPKIDPKKQQQLQSIIQSLQNTRRMRKVKNQKGEYVYEQMKLCDPTLKGMEYLEHARELGRMRKSSNRKDSIDDKSSGHQQNERKKRSINYLQQLRQSRSSSLNTSGSNLHTNKLSFLDKKDLSFHQKLQKVDRETFKLQQLTRNSQNQLKFGKFKTSQQILQYKEDIDNNHVQILRMKIKLATNGKN